MLVPIFATRDILGSLVLANGKVALLPECIQQQETAMLSLLQLILSREQVLHEAKQMFADDSYFSKDLFLANMSHEIKTPLHGMVGYCQLLQQTPLDASQQIYLQHMTQCGVQLMRIINDVLDFSKLASGNMSIQSDCFRIKNLTEEIEHAVKMTMVAKKQALSFHLRSGLPDWIVVDKQKIVQILVNLLINASNFSPTQAEIKVILENKVMHGQCYIQLAVVDSGIGISDSDQCKLFNSFVQINKCITKVGTGLGLAISKKLAELMKGVIMVESKLGIGSTFTLLVPYVQYEEYEKSVVSDIGLLANRSILLVDDVLENRLTIGDMLFEWGTRPVLCSSGREALRFITDNRYQFDVVLVDICMPEMTGVELAAQIVEIRPNLPLIALSSVAEYVNTANFQHKLDKPFLKSHLLHALYTVLGSDPLHAKLELTPPPRPRLSEARGLVRELPSISILVVEDVSYNRSLLVNMLKLLKYDTISEATDGREAIAQIAVRHFDVILLDLRMPDVDGYGVLDYMDQHDHFHRTTVVAVTASALDADRERCAKFKVSFFLAKPIHLRELKHIMDRIVQHTTAAKH